MTDRARSAAGQDRKLMIHPRRIFESPIWRHLNRDLAKGQLASSAKTPAAMVWSDWDADDISFDAFVRSEAVDARLMSCPRSVWDLGGALRSRWPTQRVIRSVSPIWRSVPLMRRADKRARTEAEKQQAAAMLTLMRLGWGQENPAFRQLFTSQFIPGATKEQADWFNELQRVSTSPESAARNLQANGDVDVTDLLSKVTVPTLVMHARGDARVPFDSGRRLAAGIPGARFVPLQSDNHLILEDEPAYARFIEEITTFVKT